MGVSSAQGGRIHRPPASAERRAEVGQIADHVDLDSNVLNTFMIEIQPESSDAAAFSSFGGLIRCRFSGKFSPKTVRAVALVLDGGGTTLSVPAQ